MVLPRQSVELRALEDAAARARAGSSGSEPPEPPGVVYHPEKGDRLVLLEVLVGVRDVIVIIIRGNEPNVASFNGPDNLPVRILICIACVGVAVRIYTVDE